MHPISFHQRKLVGALLGVVLLGALPDRGWSQPLRLSLADCVRLAVASNLDLAAKRLKKDEGQLSPAVARRLIIPTLSAGVGRTLAGGRNLEYDLKLSKRGLDGTEYGISVAGGQALEPASSSSNQISFTLSRPLLKNFGAHIFGFEVDLAKVDSEIALQLFRAELDEFVSQLADVYFDLHFAVRNYRIQQQAYDRAVEQFADTSRDIEKGVLPASAIFLVEENVVRFDVKKREAQRDIAVRQMTLSSLRNLPVAEEHPMEPSETMKREAPRAGPLDRSIRRILEHNPNYRIRVSSLDRSRIERDYYRNQVLPLLNVLLDHTLNDGIAGRRDNETIVGLRLELPLSRSADRAQSEKFRLRALQVEASLAELATSLSYEAKKLELDLDQQAQILKLKEKAIGLSQKKLDAEMEKYRNGITTLAETVRFQQQLEESQIDETQALVAFNRLILRRLKLEGSLAESFEVTIR
ncbi:MAG: TolC family protein [Candidatus Wallbacteria bacterium]|nr:TolC family protein [Candidatus Wallbacteria bacterium]